jgi:hypothetical protein
VFTGNKFAVNSNAGNVFPVDKTLLSTAFTLATTKILLNTYLVPHLIISHYLPACLISTGSNFGHEHP